MRYTFVLLCILSIALPLAACQPPLQPGLTPTPAMNPDSSGSMPPRDDPVPSEPPPIRIDDNPDFISPPPAPAKPAWLDASARRIAATALTAPASAITVRGYKAVVWSNSALGCGPSVQTRPGGAVPGYLVTVESGGKMYRVHMDANGHGILCLAER